jgi:hypothetical protein
VIEDHGKDINGTVGFVLALLYNTIYLLYNYKNLMEEDLGNKYTNE